MTIFIRGKSKYVTSTLDGNDYNITTGHFKRYLNSINTTEEQFLVEHLNEKRPLCQCCGEPARLSIVKSVTDDLKWNWASTCGEKNCAIEMRRRGRKSLTKEQEAESVRKRNETFKNDPSRLENRSKAAHEANLKIGEDGLTGYQRTKKNREETLLKKHGRADYANWEKSSNTWANKDNEEIMAHGEKIRKSWKEKPEDQKSDEIERRRATNIIKYGMECPGNLHMFKGYSELAASLFRELDYDDSCEYKPKCKEFSLNGKLFDFRKGNKLVEFNGDYWHANPLKYKSDFEVGRSRKRTAKEIWEADAKKIQLAEASGYEVKVVWESEYKKNPNKVIEECITWISS